METFLASFGKLGFFELMVNGQSELNLATRIFAYNSHKPLTNRFLRVNGKQLMIRFID